MQIKQPKLLTVLLSLSLMGTILYFFRSPIHDAVDKQNYKKIDLLLAEGANLNKTWVFTGWTPLMHAASKGRSEMVRYLLSKGADPNIQGRSGDTALILASSFGQFQTVDLLLQSGVNINSQNGNGDTALIAAAIRGNKKMVEFLLKNGADTTIQGSFKHTAAKWAAISGHHEIAQYLKNIESK